MRLTATITDSKSVKSAKGAPAGNKINSAVIGASDKIYRPLQAWLVVVVHREDSMPPTGNT